MKQCHGRWPGVWGTRDTAPSSPPLLLCAVVSRVGEEIWAQKCWGPEIPLPRRTWTCFPLEPQDAPGWPRLCQRPGMTRE